MPIPTEPIGSIPRPQALIDAVGAFSAGRIGRPALDAARETAVRETIARLEAAGSPVVSDGEQSKSSFATYPLEGMANLAPEGVVIPFADGHTRRLPVLTAGPFRYQVYARTYLDQARRHAKVPMKQAVIAPSALSLLYPQGGLAGYPREAFIADLADEAEKDIRLCLEGGAYCVQLDFTEGRLSLKLDPSGGVLREFLRINNLVLERFSAAERARIGVHTCPGGDQDSTHSADVDYAGFLPSFFTLKAGAFYVELAGEEDRKRVLRLIAEHLGKGRRAFVGVTDPISSRVETAEEGRDQVLEAAAALGPERLGSTDDCGFAPFCDDLSTSRETAFAKVAARVAGTQLASERLKV